MGRGKVKNLTKRRLPLLLADSEVFSLYSIIPFSSILPDHHTGTPIRVSLCGLCRGKAGAVSCIFALRPLPRSGEVCKTPLPCFPRRRWGIWIRSPHTGPSAVGRHDYSSICTTSKTRPSQCSFRGIPASWAFFSRAAQLISPWSSRNLRRKEADWVSS